MWNNKQISVVMPTYREKGSIRSVIADFLGTGLVDEVIVVSNNAESGTEEEVEKVKSEKVKILREPRQGYGHALQTALLAATGDYIVSVEPDGTYVGKDLKRFLQFAEDFPVVFGSRVIEKTNNKDWGYWRREVNFLYGAIIHWLFNSSTVTDVGCTYKLMTREVVRALKPHWRHGSSFFATELLLLTVAKGHKFVEIPVTFQARVGSSTVVGSVFRLAKFGLVNLGQIFLAWGRWLRKGKDIQHV